MRSATSVSGSVLIGVVGRRVRIEAAPAFRQTSVPYPTRLSYSVCKHDPAATPHDPSPGFNHRNSGSRYHRFSVKVPEAQTLVRDFHSVGELESRNKEGKRHRDK